MDVSEHSQNWWSGMRKTWKFTRISDTDEVCNVCGLVLARRASAMKAHHEFHAGQERRTPTGDTTDRRRGSLGGQARRPS